MASVVLHTRTKGSCPNTLNQLEDQLANFRSRIEKAAGEAIAPEQLEKLKNAERRLGLPNKKILPFNALQTLCKMYEKVLGEEPLSFLEEVCDPCLSFLAKNLPHSDNLSLACTSKPLSRRMQPLIGVSRIFAKIYCRGDIPPDLYNKYCVTNSGNSSLTIHHIDNFAAGIDPSDRLMVRSLRIIGSIYYDPIPRLLIYFPCLTAIRIDHREISWGSLHQLQAHEKLQKINLFNFPFNGLPLHFPYHRLTGTKISANSPKQLHSKLQVLLDLRVNLESLTISSKKLYRISIYPEKLKDLELRCYRLMQVTNLPNTLQSLTISRFQARSLPLVPESLAVLWLMHCHKIKRICHLPSNLQVLSISHASKIVAIEQIPESLKLLILTNLPKLELLPSQLPKGLTKVIIRDCPKLNPIFQSSTYNSAT